MPAGNLELPSCQLAADMLEVHQGTGVDRWHKVKHFVDGSFRVRHAAHRRSVSRSPTASAWLRSSESRVLHPVHGRNILQDLWAEAAREGDTLEASELTKLAEHVAAFRVRHSPGMHV